MRACRDEHICMSACAYVAYMNVQGSLNKFPDFFLMSNFIDSTYTKL